MEQNNLILTSWQFFSAAYKTLSIEFMQKFWSVSRQCINRWSTDPAYAESARRNPLDRMSDLFLKLHEIGKTEYVLAAGRLMFERLGYEVVPKNMPVPDKETVFEEIADDWVSLSKLVEAIQGGDSIRLIETLADEAKSEIDETVIKYKEGKPEQSLRELPKPEGKKGK